MFSFSILSIISSVIAQTVETPRFQTGEAFGSGAPFFGITSGDFNSDGKHDVIASDTNNNRLLIFYGDGTGRFAIPPVIVSNIVSPAMIAVNDFDGDGKADLAVAEDNVAPGGRDGVTILLGNGNGNFPTRVSYGTGIETTEIVTADFNSDGKPDIGVYNSFETSMSVLTGTGTGTFNAPVVYPFGTGGSKFNVVDFNNDSHPDICFASGGLRILPNNGNGTFGSIININTTPISGPGDITIGDVNSDGKMDFIVLDTFRTSNNILPMLGNGNFTFTAGTIMSVNATLNTASLFDLNRDSKNDLVIAASGRTLVLNGNGNGTFSPPKTYYAGGGRPLPIDFNGDGWLDIAATTFNQGGGQGSGNFISLLNKRNGTLIVAPGYNIGFVSGGDILVTDINSDQRKDLLTAVQSSGGNGGIGIALQNPSGGFNSPTSLSVTVSPMALISRDFNGDGINDLVFGGFGVNGGTNNAGFAPGNGTGFGTRTYFQAGSGIFDMVSDDFNNDGKADLAFASSSNVFISLGNGNGTFTPAISYYPTNSVLNSITSGDFNGDGKPDLAVTKTQTGELVTLLNNGSGGFSFNAAYAIGTFTDGAKAADLDGDQKLDLIVGADFGGVYVLRGNGNGGFSAPVQYQIPSVSVGKIEIADFNNDQKPDVVATSFYTNGAVVLINDGIGNLINQRTWATFTQAQALAVGDIDNDQKPDFVTGGSSGIVSVVINGPVKLSSGYIDFDGDGKTDIGIFRPDVGEWWINSSSTSATVAAQFGNSTDKAVPADFSGDGKTDIAFWRPSTGEWFILRSEDGSFYSVPFGASGDVPVAGDFDADGRADPTVFRPSSATWFIQQSTGGTAILTFGASGDVPVAGDYDGDNKTDIAIYRPSTGDWWIQRSSNQSVYAFQFGLSTDKPVPGDYSGDGKTDSAFFRPSTGEWFILRSEDSSFYSVPFGVSTDLPVPGDYDGDGRFDTAVFRPSDSNWYVQRSTAGLLIQQFGAPGDQPLPNVFVP